MMKNLTAIMILQTEIESDIESDVSDSNENYYCIEKFNTLKLNKNKFLANVPTSAKNVLLKLPGTLYLCFSCKLVDYTNDFN